MNWAFNHSINDCVGLSNLMRTPDFVNFQIDFYVGSVWGPFSRDGNSFVGGGLNKAVSNSVGTSASIGGGWLNQVTVSPGDTNNFVSGYAGSGTVSYAGLGGGIVISSSGATATVVGFGAGKTAGNTNNAGNINGGYTIDQGYSGIAW
ncbi:MAG: hypothetical protein WAQ53_08350 [Thiofilum sp.]|uniref:hypothetical protein n=1 Tax=Thiofilum sp. TaxID=2212733 RepID=UPI0025EDC2C3|nr:hypothetical protein [Thiofilum sp.]MBK8453790.1 hypothetical protein [Thiofilum sp.]